jgi:cytochrome c5
MGIRFIRPGRSVRAGFLGAAVGLMALGAAFQDTPVAHKAKSQIRPFVRGYIAAAVVEGRPRPSLVAVPRPRAHDVFLPKVAVHLLDLATNTPGDRITTDLSGRFTLPARPGRYRVCWKADGFGSGCANDIVSVGNDPVHVSTVRIPLPKVDGVAAVFGRVRLADGGELRLLEPLADVNVFGRVVLLDAAKKEHYEALVNNFGEYLVPQVPTRAQIYLAARVEKGEGVQELRPQANLAGAPVHRIDLTVGNSAPRVEPLVPLAASGRRLQVASPGETVSIKAQAGDPDGDPLEFRWLLDPGSGKLSATSGASIQWTLPSGDGRYSLTLITRDGKGGNVRRAVSVAVDRKGVVFSGHVVTTTGTPVPQADVTVNGRPAQTGTDGFFRLHVRPDDRYVLNVRKPGFGLVSRVFDRGLLGGRYELRRATVATVDPTQPIDVQDRRTVRDCPGAVSLRFDSKTFPAGVKPVWQDGKGRVIAAPKRERPTAAPKPRPQQTDGCGPGVRVRIPAGALVDSAGNPPVGPVQVSLSTVDISSPDQMPGEYSVALPGGGTNVMESFGAATIDISAGGKSYNLKAGTTAQVTLPVDRVQLAAGGPFPPTIPLLYYDEQRGVWAQEGTAPLVGNAYVAKVKHFSTVNADSLKVEQGCIRVDASHPGLPASFRLQVIVPMGGGNAPRLRDVLITNSAPKEHAVYNLPTNTNITLAPYDAVTRVPFGTFIVNTGSPQNPTDPNEPLGPPYLACPTTVVLAPQVLPEDPTGGEFLHGLNSFAATKLVETDIVIPGTLSNQLDQATTNYYDNVDPNGTRATLDGPNGFKTVHGFGAGGPGCTNLAAGETCAIYANTGDLGFGREMHCIKNGANVACYVTNYGDIDTPDADDVAAAVLGQAKIATVAMESAPIEGDPAAVPVVKFFVYAYNVGGVDHPEGLRVNAANLDGKGLRPVPQLCMVCHGGHYPGGANVGVPPFGNADDVKLGSEFIAFDLHNFTFAAAPFDKAGQQAAFKTLNQQFVAATSIADHTQLYIQEMYDGDNGVPAGVQEELPVVIDPTAAAGDRWDAQPSKREMYKHVVGNACRTCHATQPVPSLRFVNAKQAIDRIGQIESRVCSQHVMPHAKRTHDLFWLSSDRPDTPIVDPHQPGILQAFGTDFGGANWDGTLCGAFTPSGPPIVSAFNDIKTQIFTPLCAGCHAGAAPAGNLNLQSAQAYAQLLGAGLGQDSCERPAMKRVKPLSPSDSFLFRKLDGTHAGLGGCNVAACNPFGGETGCGQQMPWSAPPPVASNSPLSAAQLTLIQGWINSGAPN